MRIESMSGGKLPSIMLAPQRTADTVEAFRMSGLNTYEGRIRALHCFTAVGVDDSHKFIQKANGIGVANFMLEAKLCKGGN